MTAARFLRTADQYRSSFRIADWNRQTDVVSLEFIERHQPRLVRTDDNAPASGRFEIDRTTGRVTSSMLTQRSGKTVATITVRFAADANVGMWVPLTMDEEYRGAFYGLVTGAAKYSRYREFRVETSESIKH